MVELIAASVLVVLIVLGILFAVPRVQGDGAEGQSIVGRTGQWPEVLAGLDALSAWWIQKHRAWDVILAVLSIVLLAAAVAIYQDPALLGGLEEWMEFVAHPLAILGFVGVFATTYFNVRRADLSSAEATLIGMSLAGAILLILIVAILLN